VAWRYLDLVDYLLIAEEVPGVPARTLARLDRIVLAESALAVPAARFDGVEIYPEMRLKAAALLWHLTRNHPLPDGNKRCAFLATVEFVQRNDHVWVRSPADPDDTDAVVRKVASGRIGKEALAGWIGRRVASSGRP
jgi:death-on-curing protein